MHLAWLYFNYGLAQVKKAVHTETKSFTSNSSSVRIDYAVEGTTSAQ